MFVKRRNTANNSAKVLAIRLHDNSNMSAPEPAVKGALVIIYRLAVLMFFLFLYFFFCFHDFPVEYGQGGLEKWEGRKKQNNLCPFFSSSHCLFPLAFHPP